MVSVMSKKPNRYSSKKLKQAKKERELVQAVRRDLHQPSDAAWGTSPGSLGLVKAASEEARHETCFECGYSAGRHARICSRH